MNERFEITCGDAFENLQKLADGSIDVFFTSPPYNLGEKAKNSNQWSGGKSGRWKNAALQNGYANYDDNMPYEKYKAWQGEILSEMWRALSPIGAIFYNHKPRIFNGDLRLPTAWTSHIPLRQIVIWNRGGVINFSPYFFGPMQEWVMIFAKPDFHLKSRGASGVGDVWNITPEINTKHPAPFPLELVMKPLRELGPEYKTVCDPFSGSGTVGVASIKTKRRFIGFEISPEYVAGAVKRLADEASQITIEAFIDDPARQIDIFEEINQ